MKKQIIVLISLALFIVTLNGISAAVYTSSSMCGDGLCDTGYNENSILSPNYCPADCGTPDRDCPICIPCDTSRLTNSELTNWCNNNYNCEETSTCPFPWVENIALFEITGNKCKDGLIFFGIGIFIIAGILGFLIKKKRHKRK